MAPDTPKSGDGVTQCKNDGFLLHSFNEKISGLLYIRDLISMKSFKLFLRKEFEAVFELILTEFEGAMRAS